MSFFTRKINDHLLVNEPADGEWGYWIAVLKNPAPSENPELAEVWNKPPVPDPPAEEPVVSGEENTPPAEESPEPAPEDPGTLASLVFCYSEITSEHADAFKNKVVQLLENKGIERAIIWLTSVEEVDVDHAIMLGVDATGKNIISNLLIPGDYFLPLQINAGATLTLTESNFLIDKVADFQSLGGGFAGSAIALNMSGSRRASLSFGLEMSQENVCKQTGFQFYFPDEAGGIHSNWLPLATPKPEQKAVFESVIHPLDVFGEQLNTLNDQNSNDFSITKTYQLRSTFLEFTGKNVSGEETTLASFYRTIFGEVVTLLPLAAQQTGLPARLVPTKGFDSSGAPVHFLSPEGDFILQSQDKSDKPYELICGLQGTEFFEYRGKSSSYAGDRLRFLAGQAAHSPNFPFKEVSPLGPPLDAGAPLLTKEFTTAWTTVLPGKPEEKIEYVPQAQEAALYGVEDTVSSIGNLLGNLSPAYTLPVADRLLFPMPPYGGAVPGSEGFTLERLEMFESQVLSTIRRDRIGDAAGVQTSSERLRRQRATIGSGTSLNVTTPSGVLVNVDTSNGGARWKKIILGQKTVLDEGSPDLIVFHNPKDNLQQAFSTADLFLVVANPLNLGKNKPINPGTEPAYDAQINMENWILNAQVGANVYGDYTNIMIFKSQKGALYDPDPKKSLVANPNKWTQKTDFAAPTTEDKSSEPDANQLVILANWLQEYFAEAAAQEKNPFFEKFNQLATNPNWQGVLILRMDIEQLPQELAGIRAGVKDESAFYAHHFGIEINQIKKDSDVHIKDDSSMFGLIYYEDPDFQKPTKGELVQPVPPDNTDDYDFRLLTLKVLFENSRIKEFESYAQVTLNQLFGMRPSRMSTAGNPFNTIVLRGSYHNVNGKPVYGLGTETDYSFFFANNLFNKIEVTGAQLLTRNIKGKDVSCWFALRGYLDFRVLNRVRDGVPVDLIGFGSAENLAIAEDGQPRRGLHFSNLGLEMNFKTDNPQDKTFAFNIQEIRFDQARSTSRKGSLYTDFAMELKGMIAGVKDIPPTMQGYLNVVTDVGTAGVSGSEWYGLRYHLNLGTPGELAGKVSLDSELIFAWSPESAGASSYKAMIGIELPGSGGANLFDLQNVLKLSIGQVRLLYADEGDRKGFLLMLTEIALKFLGLLKIPPSGSTNFYLFGNPNAGGEASGLGWYAVYRQQV